MSWYTLGGQVVVSGFGAIFSDVSVPPGPPSATPSGDPYPRVLSYCIGGNVAYNNSTFKTNAGWYNTVVFTCYLSNSEGTMGTTYPALFAAIKATPQNGLPVPTRCLMYIMSSEQSTVGGGGNQNTFTKWSAQINNANWWVRNPYPGGSIVTQDANSGNILSSQDSVVYHIAGPFNGLNMFGAFAQYFTDVLVNGQAVTKYGEANALAADNQLDGFFLDNQFDRIRQNGDWGFTGATSGPTTVAGATTDAWIQQGGALQVAAFRAANPGAFIAGNTDYFVYKAFGTPVTLDPTQNGLFDYNFCEQAIGTSGSIEEVLTFAACMTGLIAAEAQVSAGGVLVLGQYGASGTLAWTATQSSWTTAMWKGWRFGAAMANLRNWAWEPNISGSNQNIILLGDELKQNGSVGWLGQPIDSPQSASWLQGVWMRRYQNGIVLCNPKGNGSQTVTLPVGNWSNLTNIGAAYGDPAVNNGPNTVTSVTLADRDGLFLIGDSFVHNQLFTFTGSGFGTKSRGLTPILDDHGQAGVTGGTGTLDPQWSNRGNNSTSPTYDFYRFQNRTVGFAPTGAAIGAPHPFVQAILAADHYGDIGSYTMYVNKGFVLPTLPCVVYARWYERQDPNSWTNGTSTENNKCGSFDMVSTPLIRATIIHQLVVGGPQNPGPSTWQMSCGGDNLLAWGGPPNGIQAVDNNGHQIPSGWGQCPSPYNNGWVLKEWEICVDSVFGAASKGYNRYSACVGGVVYPILGIVGAVRTGTGTFYTSGAGDGYHGGTEVDTGATTSRYISFGNGELGNPGPKSLYNYVGSPGPPADSYNWIYFADFRIDVTGGSVSGNVARVIIGDQPTLAASAIRAFCNVTAWSNTSITATAWKDQFVTGQTGYVHVVTESSGVLDNQFSGVWA